MTSLPTWADRRQAVSITVATGGAASPCMDTEGERCCDGTSIQLEFIGQ